ncbi:rho GTPase-activating protein REN1-like isoform X1 [Tripterygium wilfordii]|uniref:rho GTPase-activating protein REN1-like isoform X1 n=1 Tax=Tripterygium wilfordii TaxID=458696 RepID=UPI0018F8505F|nr:rho GTPase-activating protein REN1-like isoform X1 [Tripterygium wilfordii]
MASKIEKEKEEPSQGGGGAPAPPPPPPGPPDHLRTRGNSVFKSGPLFLSSKGIGWTSWKKRWFILTRTSLVFFRSDPAETLEDLYEWKNALESALAQAPNAALVMGQNGIFRNEQGDAVDGSKETLKDRHPIIKSTVIGRPILLALEDIDGAPSFLEKALRFVEEQGVRVEGILRQAADVDDVEHRVREYEQGKREFSLEEDPHVVADCVKYVLRELPSSPVPASCCNALLEACRTDHGSRVNAMRAAICGTFPEPNRRLLQRILMMMQTVASHKADNRMSSSAVAACMAPLLLRPLLAGDCEIETNFNVGGDGSIQLLRAAAAANHAQAIVITLLEEYNTIFGEGSMSPELFSDTEESGSEAEEATDDDESYEDDEDDDATEGTDVYTVDDLENASSGACSNSGESGEEDIHDDKSVDDFSSDSMSPKVHTDSRNNKELSSRDHQTTQTQHEIVQETESLANQNANRLAEEKADNSELSYNAFVVSSLECNVPDPSPLPQIQKSTTISNGPVQSCRRPTVWGCTPAKKNLSMESIDYPVEDELEVQRLEATKIDLQNKIAEEVKGNAALQVSLERRKNALHEHRLALQQDVARLQEQLQKEREKRTALELGLDTSQQPRQVADTIDEKTKAQLDEIAEAEVMNFEQKVDDLGTPLNQQRGQNHGSISGSCNWNPPVKVNDKQKDAEDTSSSHPIGRSASKDNHVDEADIGNQKQESFSLPDKHPQQNQQMDPVRNNNSKSVSTTPNSSTGKQVVGRPNASNSKRSGNRSEGTNSTTSALSKLTTRLNFLKEQRSQITNELQNMDKGRNSGQDVSNMDRGQGSDSRHQSLQNQDKDEDLVHQEKERIG